MDGWTYTQAQREIERVKEDVFLINQSCQFLLDKRGGTWFPVEWEPKELEMSRS